jgi:Flp pilus assembly protein TadG
MTASRLPQSTVAVGRGAGDRGDEGTIMILMFVLAAVIAAVVTVIVDASTVFLAERQLQAVADGAAAAAAEHADVGSIYRSGAGDNLPLSAAEVTTAVNDYVAVPGRRPHECGGTEKVVVASTDGQTVTVGLTCQVPLPFVAVVAQLWSKGVTIDVVAHARTAVTPTG